MLSLSVVETCTKCPWWSTTCTRFPIQNRLVFGYYCANCDRKSVTHQSSKNAQRQVHLQISCQAARLPLQKFSTPTPSIASLLCRIPAIFPLSFQPAMFLLEFVVFRCIAAHQSWASAVSCLSRHSKIVCFMPLVLLPCSVKLLLVLKGLPLLHLCLPRTILLPEDVCIRSH
jgi:hypothetical protein